MSIDLGSLKQKQLDSYASLMAQKNQLETQIKLLQTQLNDVEKRMFEADVKHQTYKELEALEQTQGVDA